MYFILFDKGDCTPVGTSRVEDPNFLCVPVSQEKFIAVVSEPFRIQRQVLVKTSVVGQYEVKESEDFVRSNLALSLLTQKQTADVLIVVDSNRISAKVVEAYPLNLVPVTVVVLSGVYSPIGEFTLGLHDRPEHKLAVPKQYNFYVRHPFVDFTYGLEIVGGLR